MAAWDARWRDSPGTVPERLAAELRSWIERGVVSPGAALPSERHLARDANVSRSSVATALELLEAAGWCDRRDRARAMARLPDATDQALAPTSNRDISLDFFTARVAAPAELFERALDRARTKLIPHLLSDGRLARGLPDLRAGIADRFARGGLPTTVEQIIVTNGAMGALNTILDVTRGSVLVENPTYHVALRMIASRRRSRIGWTRANQWDVVSLDRLVRRHAPSVAYLVPDFHNPTGALASNPERALLEGLDRHVPFIVVDETLREIDLRPAAAERMPEHLATCVANALTIGGMAKSVWSGLRIGWMRVPERAQRDLLSSFAEAQSVPIIDQLVAAQLLGELDGIVATRTERLRQQRDSLVGALRRHGFRIEPPAGGLAVWVDIGAPRAEQLAARMAEEGVRIATGGNFAVDRSCEAFVRLPITHESATAAMVVDSMAAHLRVIADGRTKVRG